uniref:Uncharacterized protein n=1 Tax=Strigamia maritima TaxID=126957 RepID=T1IVU6_STRMM
MKVITSKPSRNQEYFAVCHLCAKLHLLPSASEHWSLPLCPILRLYTTYMTHKWKLKHFSDTP